MSQEHSATNGHLRHTLSVSLRDHEEEGWKTVRARDQGRPEGKQYLLKNLVCPFEKMATVNQKVMKPNNSLKLEFLLECSELYI